MIRNVIFDMGQVLIRFDPEYFITRLGIQSADKERLLQEVFRSREWVQLDMGSITDAEATAHICRRLPEHLHDAAGKLVRMWDRPILPIEGMYQLIEELKANNYGVYLLSNASLRQHDYWPRVPVSRFFDGKVISADENVMKPQSEIYQILLERFSLKAEECIFVDDVPANVQGAAVCGIPGILFRGDADLLRRELRAAGVNITV